MINKENIYLKVVGLLINVRVELEPTPDPHTSGNRCANKLVPRYPTRLIVKVLISRITVYSILTFLPNNRLVTTRHIPLNEAKNVEEFIQSVPGKPDPDPVLISAYVPDTRSDTDFLCSLHP